MTMNQRILLSICESIQINKEILNFISSFLKLKGKDPNGNDILFSYDCFGIPPVGLLSKILLNIYLSILDREFTRSYPNVPYYRYLTEAYVLVPSNDVEPDDIYVEPNEVFTTFFFELDIDGKITIISPGDPYIPCLYGHIRITEDSLIQFTSNLE